ncbi:MAG: M28 family peptidase, partial [Promethearchaeota archaeon]
MQGTNCQNLLFKLNEEKKNIVILGAHYDTRARATKDNDNPNDPVPGANDGASGCAVLLELARVLFKRK